MIQDLTKVLEKFRSNNKQNLDIRLDRMNEQFVCVFPNEDSFEEMRERVFSSDTRGSFPGREVLNLPFDPHLR